MLIFIMTNGGLVEVSTRRKVLFILPDELLMEFDNVAAEGKLSRSELIRDAMRLIIKEKRKKTLAEKLKRGYERMGVINLQLAEEGLGVHCGQLDVYEEKLAECE